MPKSTKPAAKPAAKTAKVAAVKHSRMTSDQLVAVIRSAIKADASLATSWSKCLRSLRAAGKASGSTETFRAAFIKAGGNAPKAIAKPTAKPAAKRAASTKPAAKRTPAKSAAKRTTSKRTAKAS